MSAYWVYNDSIMVLSLNGLQISLNGLQIIDMHCRLQGFFYFESSGKYLLTTQ